MGLSGIECGKIMYADTHLKKFPVLRFPLNILTYKMSVPVVILGFLGDPISVT